MLTLEQGPLWTQAGTLVLASRPEGILSINQLCLIDCQSLSLHQSGKEWPCLVHVHVDDLTITSTNVEKLKKPIQNKYECDDLGELWYILGMKVERACKARTISLSQTNFIEDLLMEYNMETSASVTTPMKPGDYLWPATQEECDQFEETHQSYHHGIGKIQYLGQAT